MSRSNPDATRAQRSDLREYLRHAGDLSPAELIELLCADHAERWRNGERIPVEAYLQLHPNLTRESAAAFELVYAEYVLREEMGDRPSVEEYAWRFPHFTDRLRRQLSLHLALGFEDPEESVAGSADSPTLGRGLTERVLTRARSPDWPVLDGYEILGELGRGGMGTVYKARQLSLGRVVALKVVRRGPGVRDEDVERLRAEATAAARLQHPHIVQIHEIGTQDGLWYLALEYVDGGTLEQRLAGIPQDPGEAAHLVETLARAVHHAHERGIIHRDLKPANVLLQRADQASGPASAAEIDPLRSLIPKVTDFGLAKRLDQEIGQTSTGTVLGSPCYMAPEQARGENRQITAAADVHALGAVLYEMLTGQPPFKGATVLATLEQVANRDPVPPRQLQPQTPRDLETICLACLAKEPRQRYASAAALADDLRRFQRGEPVVARPTPARERLWRWARREPLVASLTAAVVTVALAGFALVLWQWLRAEDKASAAASAGEAAKQARRLALEEQARLALYQGLALCDQGDVGRGLLWLAYALDLAAQTGANKLEHAIRVNLADWATQLSPSQRTMQHGASVLHLAFAPDGKTLASVGKSAEIHLWDTATGQEIGPALMHSARRYDWMTRFVNRNPSPVWIGRVAFNPKDPRLAVTVDDDGRACLWDVVRRQPLGAPLPHPNNHMIWGAAFHPDGHRLVTICDDGAVRWWNVATHAAIGKPWWHSRTQPGYYTLALSPDGRTLATGGRDRQVVRWNVASGERLEPALLHDSNVVRITFTQDGQQLITSTRGGTVHVWDSSTGRPQDLPAQGSEVTGLDVRSDGRILATGSGGGIVRLWDTATWQPVGQTSVFSASVTAVAFSPDSKTLAVGQDDGTIGLTTLPQVRAVDSPLAVGSPVQYVAFNKGGTHLLTGSSGGALWWDLATGQGSGPLIHNRAEVPGARVYDLAVRTYSPRDEVFGTAYSPDGRTVATVHSSGTEGYFVGRAELWDAVTGKLLGQTEPQSEPLRGVVYSPDGRSLLTWGADPRRTMLWDAATLKPLRPLLQGLTVSIRQAVFSPDGQALLLACSDGQARFWDLANDREIDPGHCPTHAYPLTAVAYGPGGEKVATGCHAGTVRLWDVAERKLLGDLRGNAGEIAALAFSADGAVLLTGSFDGTARFWDVATGSPLGPPLRHAAAVLSVAFHPNARIAATGSKDGRAQLWRVPSAPRLGDLEEVRMWVEVLTGQEFTDNPLGVRALGSDALLERRGRLREREASDKEARRD
jgi:WD40 repeat protein/serine/threonine protein kinase